MLPGQYNEYLNKDDPALFYPPINYRPTPIPRTKDLNLTEQQWNQFDWMYAKALSPFVFDQLTTSKLGRIPQKDHIYQDYQTSVMELLKSLIYTPKFSNQYQKQQQAQSYLQQNKLYNQKQNVKTNYKQQMNQKESQLMEQMTMETMTNLSTQLNPSISFQKMMDSEKIIAGRIYRPLSTEKRILISISQKHSPTLHLTLQTDQMDSEETVAGRSYRQHPTKIVTQTIKQSITLAMKTIKSKLMIIEPEVNKTIKDPTTKPNMNKIMEASNQEKWDHLIQPIPNKNQVIQIFDSHKAYHLQSLHFQNAAKLKGKLQCPDKGCNQPTIMILEAKQANQKPYPTIPKGVPKMEPTLTLLTTSYPSRSREKRQMQLQLLKTSPQNTPKAIRPVQDPRNRNKDSTPKTRQKQSPIPRLTSRISWTKQER
ncbi:MAG: hypothetical protein EZS28_040969, partial [Streblomastix strix]